MVTRKSEQTQTDLTSLMKLISCPGFLILYTTTKASPSPMMSSLLSSLRQSVAPSRITVQPSLHLLGPEGFEEFPVSPKLWFLSSGDAISVCLSLSLSLPVSMFLSISVSLSVHVCLSFLSLSLRGSHSVSQASLKLHSYPLALVSQGQGL